MVVSDHSDHADHNAAYNLEFLGLAESMISVYSKTERCVPIRTVFSNHESRLSDESSTDWND
jgi:hypothetical protein